MVSSTSSSKDYYKELEIDRNATTAEVRAAYRRLALVWHPDRNKAKEAEEKFKLIKKAYDVLSDQIRRREYDQERKSNLVEEQNWFEDATVNQSPFDFCAFENIFSTPIDPLDILSDIQFFQESNFTSKMLNSPEYRRLYTQIFHSMNPGPNGISPNDNDRLLRSNRKSHRQKHRHSSKRHSFPTAPVIGTTMPNDSLLNDLIDHCEQERRSSVWFDERFLQDFNHCRYCWKKVSSDQRHLIEHEERCRSRADSRRYQTRMS